MAKVFAGNDGCQALTIAGADVRRRKGGFEVPDKLARKVADAIGGAVSGVRIGGSEASTALGPWCEHNARPYFCTEDVCEARDRDKERSADAASQALSRQ